MALLVLGAVIDGREDDQRRAENEHADASDADVVPLGVVGGR